VVCSASVTDFVWSFCVYRNGGIIFVGGSCVVGVRGVWPVPCLGPLGGGGEQKLRKKKH